MHDDDEWGNMAIRIVHTAPSACPTEAEVALVGSMLAKHGRTVLLVPDFAERGACQRALARRNLGVGIEVTTPSAWIAALWELLGDGRQMVSALQRRLVMARVLAERAAAAPEGGHEKVSPGMVDMLSQAACDMLPYLPADARGLSPGEASLCETLRRYMAVVDGRGLVEASSAAAALTACLEGLLPACARSVVVRGVHDVPEYLLGLLLAVARDGELAILAESEVPDVARELEARAAAQGVEVIVEPAGEAPGADRSALQSAALTCTFFPVAGPAARDAAYAALVGRAAATVSPASVRPEPRVVVAVPNPLAMFRALAPRLAAQGVASQVSVRAALGDTRAGEAIAMLADLLDRMENEEASSWWPAPEIPDWIRSPFSGLGPVAPRVARTLDSRLRKTRQMGKDELFAELESLQSREVNRERKLADEQGRPRRAIVVKDVLDALCARHLTRALQLMREAAATAPAQLFGAGGMAVKRQELAAIDAALDLLAEARRLDVSEEQAFSVLPSCPIRLSERCMPQVAGGGTDAGGDLAVTDPASGGPSAAPALSSATPEAAAVAFCALDELSAQPASSYRAVLLFDADAESYPLARRETPASILAEKLGCAGVHAAPIGCQRIAFARAVAAGEAAALAYVAHDRQGDERYPALAYSELEEAHRAAAPAGADAPWARLTLPHEGAVYENLDLAGGAGTAYRTVRAAGMHALPPDLHRYVLLPERSVGGRAVPRTLSASQIENYLACPYRWLVSNRVSTRRLDVGFGPIERGNFVHDVMQRFHERLIERGLMRVRPETVDACMAEMDLAFAEIVEDHRAGRYTHGRYARDEKPRAIRGALVPLDTLERSQLQAMLTELHEVVRYESEILSIFTPAQFEYSFDREGVMYAGHPLGGRIDRIDVAPSAGAGERFVVIDYKNRTSMGEFACPDPTMALDEHEPLPEDWLPGRMADRAPKVQTLIYAQALERMGGRSAQGAVYLGTRGPVTAGAVSDALASSEPPAFPHDKVSGYPGVRPPRSRTAKHDGSLGFQELLDQVEHAIEAELGALEQGAIAPRPASDSCTYCPIKMCEKRR